MDMWDKHTLGQVTKARRKKQTLQPLADSITKFVRREVTARQKKLNRLGQVWQELLPDELLKHTCLENLYQGTLRVLVDNSSSLFELNHVKETLTEQLRELCPTTAPSRIQFVRGYWYQMNEEGIQIPVFKNIRPRKHKNKNNG